MYKLECPSAPASVNSQHNNANNYLQAPTVSVYGNPMNAAVNAMHIYNHIHICTIRILPSTIIYTYINASPQLQQQQ